MAGLRNSVPEKEHERGESADCAEGTHGECQIDQCLLCNRSRYRIGREFDQIEYDPAEPGSDADQRLCRKSIDAEEV